MVTYVLPVATAAERTPPAKNMIDTTRGACSVAGAGGDFPIKLPKKARRATVAPPLMRMLVVRAIFPLSGVFALSSVVGEI